MLKILKELVISIVLTLLLLFFLSVLISQTNLSESLAKPISMGIVSFALLIGGFRISKSKKEKGIINGCILGFVYMFFLYLASSSVNLNFSLSLSSIIMIVLGIIGGAIGGILGVNL